MTPPLADLLRCVASWADEIRSLAAARFRTGLPMQVKPDGSPVTRADREIEAAWRARIAGRWPEHGVIGEEAGVERPDAEWLWAIDPVDGTAAFVTGSPLWGMLVALLHRQRPVLGLIDMPMLDERWLATAGAVTTFNARPCRSSGMVELGAARLTTTTPEAFDATGRRRFDALRSRVALTRYGGDCHSYGLLASGHVDLVVDAGLDAHDWLALAPVVEGAGGTITDWRGTPLGLHGDGCVLAAATPALHRQALCVLDVA